MRRRSGRVASPIDIDVPGSAEGPDGVTRVVDQGGIPRGPTCPFESTGEALASLEVGRVRGKVVLVVTTA